MGSIIEVKNLSKKFGDKEVLKSVNLDISENKIFGIIGISGSGKTTILKAIVGYYKPTQGKVLIKDKDISKSGRDIKKQIGFSTQDNCFYPKLTVEENLYYFGSLYSMKKEQIKKRIVEMLPLVELDQSKNVLAEQLSGGMQRRLDLACSLIHNPKILILDEPTEDLDPNLRRELLELIKKINQEGTTVILTTHLLGEAEHICDEIAILNDKEIIFSGNVNKLRSTYKDNNDEIHLRLSSNKYDYIIDKLKKDVNGAKVVKNGLVIYTTNAQKLLISILKIIESKKDTIIKLEVQKPSLNEIFQNMTKKKK